LAADDNSAQADPALVPVHDVAQLAGGQVAGDQPGRPQPFVCTGGQHHRVGFDS
jgi:hypothetical protein